MATAKVNPLIKKLRGNIGDLIICRRRGRTYLRSRVIPRNPRTEKQMENRSKFSLAVEAWQSLPESEKDKYRYRARRRKYYGYNLFISEYMHGKVENLIYSAAGSDPASAEEGSDPLKLSALTDATMNRNTLSGHEPVSDVNRARNTGWRGRGFFHLPGLSKT